MNETSENKSETLEDKIQAVSAPVTASETKVKRGTGWKIATIVLAIFAIIGCGGLCYLFFVDGSTSLLGRTVTSGKTVKEEPKDEPKKDEPKKDEPKYEDKISLSQDSDKGIWHFLFKELFIRLDGQVGRITDYEYSESYGGLRRLRLWYHTCLEGDDCDDTPSFATKEGNEYGLAEIEIFDGLENVPEDATNRKYVGTVNGDKEIYVQIFDKEWYERYDITVPGDDAYEQRWLNDDAKQLGEILGDIQNYTGTDY
ncbi:MAG: hypothetical protein K6G36_03070 [Candidatus Saccharibacteria bacterium]|nr:hypothetical protein [Candidatus Saccharibacteria bacterium]